MKLHYCRTKTRSSGVFRGLAAALATILLQKGQEMCFELRSIRFPLDSKSEGERKIWLLERVYLEC